MPELSPRDDLPNAPTKFSSSFLNCNPSPSRIAFRDLHKTQMDDTQADPAMLEAMGFTAFGTNPGKKRKLNAAEAFVDPDVSSAHVQETAALSDGMQSNVTMTHSNKASERRHTSMSSKSAATTSGKQLDARPFLLPDAGATPSSFASQIDGDDEESLLALRNGVPNQYGDPVYFLPDFLDDPWKRLRKS